MLTPTLTAVLWLGSLPGCVPRLPDEDLVTGLEVVTVVAEPPEVSAIEEYALTAWVADAWQRGAEVVVWPCTPVDLGDRVRCAEGLDINEVGIRTSYWTETGVVRDHHFTARMVTPLVPFLAFTESAGPDQYKQGLPMPVYALACEPGVCSLFDWLRADPDPGTEAYAQLARTLADPELLADQAPIGQMSLAVKLVTVVDPTAERIGNPTLELLGRRGVPGTGGFEWLWQVTPSGAAPEPEPTTTYPYYDGDDDDDSVSRPNQPIDWSVRVGYTSGRIIERTFDGSQLVVDWQADFDRDGVMVIGISDGRGGTAGGAVDLPQREGEGE